MRWSPGLRVWRLYGLPINPQIARLCDEGAIEDYPGEEFAPIVERLMKVLPTGKSPVQAWCDLSCNLRYSGTDRGRSSAACKKGANQ